MSFALLMKEFILQILPVLAVVGQAIIFVLIITAALQWNSFRRFAHSKGLLCAFVVAVIATAGSLFYSEVAGYEPCKLCWWQRIFMYPQVVLLGIALLKRDTAVRFYAISLSAIGAVIAAYHYLLQLDIAPAIPCQAIGYSALCSQRFVMAFGYVTIPMMALTAFLLIIAFLVLQNRNNENH